MIHFVNKYFMSSAVVCQFIRHKQKQTDTCRLMYQKTKEAIWHGQDHVVPSDFGLILGVPWAKQVQQILKNEC